MIGMVLHLVIEMDLLLDLPWGRSLVDMLGHQSESKIEEVSKANTI